jgi:hypothetical protein
VKRCAAIPLTGGRVYLEKNYGAEGVVAEESGRDAQVTHVALDHDPTHRSYVEIPIAAAP